MQPDHESTRYRWRASVGGTISGSMVANENRVYAGSQGGYVVALDARQGTLLAQSPELGGKVEGGISLWIDGGRARLVVPCGDGNLYLLDGRDLAVLSVVRAGGQLRSAAVVQGSRAYLSSEDGFVAVVDLAAGSITARWRAKGGIKGSPVLWGRWLLYGSRDGHLYLADRQGDGTVLWQFSTQHQIQAPPVYDEKLGLIFVGSLDQTLYAVDRAGCERGKVRVGGQIVGAFLLAAAGTADAKAARLFVGCTDGKLYGLDAARLKPLWPPIPTGDWIVARPATWGRALVWGSQDGHLYVADSANGRLMWRFPAGSAIQAPPLVAADGMVYAGTVDGDLYALPWHLCNYGDAAAWLETQADAQAEAGELWLQAGNQERAFACMRRASAWPRLAEMAEGAGRYGEAGRAFEQAALASPPDAPDRGHYYVRAALSWEHEGRPGEAARCRREDARLRRAPFLVVEPQTPPAVSAGDHVTLTARLRNEGFGTASAVLMRVSGQVTNERSLETQPMAPGEQRNLAVEDVEPGQSGHAVIHIVVEYEAPDGRPEEPACAEMRLLVVPRPVQEIHVHGDYVEGDKVTGDKHVGDKVAGDQVKVTHTAADGSSRPTEA